MSAVFRREVQSYFSSPIGYIFLAVFYVLASFFFVSSVLYGTTTDVSPVFSDMFTFVFFLIPLLTMRLFSEDLKHRTDQALLTAPVSLTGLVIGKFLAAMFMFFVALSVTVVFGLIVSYFGPTNWAVLWGNFFGMLFLAMALVSIGMFISSTTENQVISAVGAFAVSFALLFIDILSSLIRNEVVSKIVKGLSFFSRYTDFTVGLFDFADIVYFFSVAAVFIFLTVRVFEKKRWG